jgi:hypothetical protein
MHGGGERCVGSFVGRPKGRRPLGSPRHRWEDNIKMELREIGIDGANWIRLAQIGFCEQGKEPSGSIKKAGYF